MNQRYYNFLTYSGATYFFFLTTNRQLEIDKEENSREREREKYSKYLYKMYNIMEMENSGELISDMENEYRIKKVLRESIF